VITFFFFFDLKLREAIISLCNLLPEEAFLVRGELMKNQILPQVMLQLTLSHCKDDLIFLNLLFEASPDWVAMEPTIPSLLSSIRTRILSLIQSQIIVSPLFTPPSSLFQVLSGLHRFFFPFRALMKSPLTRLMSVPWWGSIVDSLPISIFL